MQQIVQQKHWTKYFHLEDKDVIFIMCIDIISITTVLTSQITMYQITIMAMISQAWLEPPTLISWMHANCNSRSPYSLGHENLWRPEYLLSHCCKWQTGRKGTGNHVISFKNIKFSDIMIIIKRDVCTHWSNAYCKMLSILCLSHIA